MGKSTKNLKTALQSHQSRQKHKQKAAHAAQVAEQKQKKNGPKTRAVLPSSSQTNLTAPKGKAKATAAPPKRPTIPFQPTDKILLIGEGNFSFALALVVDPPPQLQSLPPANITATAYDTEPECYEKYPESVEIVSSIRKIGVEVLFGVDGTRLEKNSKLKGRKWDRIVWNFPHAGKGIADQDRNILSNQLLVLGFLRSAGKMLTLGRVPVFVAPRKKKKSKDDDDDDGEEEDEEEGSLPVDIGEDGELQFFSPAEVIKSRGTVQITLRNVAPYTLWDIPRLAKNPPPPTGSNPPNPPYTLLRSFAFHRSVWKGYEHRMTKGERAHGTGKTGEGGEDRTWEFCLRDTKE